MSTFGKVLLVLNLLGAIAVFAFIPMTYAKRQSWAYAVYLHDLRIEGLPFDKDEKDRDGNLVSDKLTKGVARDLFQQAGASGGGEVQTQKEELDKVRSQVQQRLDNAEAPGTRDQKLAQVLLPFARTYSQREAYLRVQAGEQNVRPAEALEADFNALFEEVNGTRAPAARKRLTARLLFGFADVLNEGQQPGEGGAPAGFFASGAYKRATVVVGLAAAVREVDSQASELQSLGEQINILLDRDRERFLAHHARLIYEIQNYADDLARQRDQLDLLNSEAAKHEALRNERATEVMKLKQEYEKHRKDTQERLTEQAEREQRIFDRLRLLRDTMKANEDLEKELRRLESGSAGQ